MKSMKLETWKIEASGPSGLHIGRHGIGQERSADTFASDSLFSAVVSVLAERLSAEEFAAFIEPFQSGNPPFVLSSAFPYAGSVRFYPVPHAVIGKDPGKTEAKQLRTKDLKKIRFVSEVIFRQLLKGKSLADVYDHDAIYDGQFLVSKTEQNKLPGQVRNRKMKIVQVDERPRVTIDRIDSKSTLFFTGAARFAPDCGLWFAIHWLDQEAIFSKLLKEAFSLLSDTGIGGDRSSGYGHITIGKKSWEEIELPAPEDGHWVSLSRYLPRPDEMESLTAASASYRLETVGGWLQSPHQAAERRRSLHMLSEGSVLGAVPADVCGQMADVRPVYGDLQFAHPVWRSGYALGVGLMEGGENA